MSLGNKIKENRAKLNLTQQELANKIHVSRQTISNWEVERSYPDIESLILLSDMFNLSLDKLLREDVKMISSFNRKKWLNVIFISCIFCLFLGGIVSAIVDVAINKSFTWSLIVLGGCLFVGIFLSIFKYSKSYHLLKASLGSIVTLFLLFLTIQKNVPKLNFLLLLQISSCAFLVVILVVGLIELSKMTFWQIGVMTCLACILVNITISLLLKENLLGLNTMINALSNLLLIVIFVFVDRLKIDKGKLTLFLNKYRVYTKNKI